MTHFDFDSTGVFRILQLTDLHFEDGGEKDQKTAALVTHMIEKTQPHLLFLTGDFVTCEQNDSLAPSLLGPVTQSGVPWVYVFGNHDTEYGVGYKQMIAVLETLPNGVTPPTAPRVHGHSNFVLTLGADDKKPEWLLVGLDSGGYNPNPLVGGYDYPRLNQIAWYDRQIKERRRQGSDFGALCFLHIPLPEYHLAVRAKDLQGRKLEGICSPLQNSGLFSTMVAGGHTRGVFCGHDHLNDFAGTLYGVRLCFGRASGYNTYGRRGYQRGARLITLTKGNTQSFETEVILNEEP